MPESPDWKNPDHYPKPEDVDLEWWACAFLSRNKNFLAEWKEAMAQGGLDLINQGPVPPNWRDTPTGKVFEKYGVMPPNVNNFFISRQPFNFDYLYYPKKAHVTELGVKGDDWPQQLKGNQFYITPKLEFNISLEFSLGLPLSAQIDRAEKILEEQQVKLMGKREQVGKHVSLFPFYLRVLDAKAAGAKDEKICDVLDESYPKTLDSSLLNKWKRKALEYVDGGYLKILIGKQNSP